MTRQDGEYADGREIVQEFALHMGIQCIQTDHAYRNKAVAVAGTIKFGSSKVAWKLYVSGTTTTQKTTQPNY
jgi:hypothetical protein